MRTTGSTQSLRGTQFNGTWVCQNILNLKMHSMQGNRGRMCQVRYSSRSTYFFEEALKDLEWVAWSDGLKWFLMRLKRDVKEDLMIERIQVKNTMKKGNRPTYIPDLYSWCVSVVKLIAPWFQRSLLDYILTPSPTMENDRHVTDLYCRAGRDWIGTNIFTEIYGQCG